MSELSLWIAGLVGVLLGYVWGWHVEAAIWRGHAKSRTAKESAGTRYLVVYRDQRDD